MESESRSPIAMNFMAERTKVAAPGMAGGRDGGLGEVRINGRSIDNRRPHLLSLGDLVLVRTPGGGGHGQAEARNPALARRDRLMGYVRAIPAVPSRAPRRRGRGRRARSSRG